MTRAFLKGLLPRRRDRQPAPPPDGLYRQVAALLVPGPPGAAERLLGSLAFDGTARGPGHGPGHGTAPGGAARQRRRSR
ncbi:hypothetical protein SAMN06265365_1188 [Tistlia consotensis]|uniref:Uncharacterized protein n=2 Tax=Tistlia TaxID=1321364 RepID=A0A1Y6C9N5_9PROT|nr:hypothetical protein SAMN05428998_1199 [Tistlia consotensis USBA 355]SNR85251.1 hypothetical protein SAMN06265365_1188 [Tistlia consotensis]